MNKILKINIEKSSRGSSRASKRNPFVHDFKTSTTD
jgi:hypothetical protein